MSNTAPQVCTRLIDDVFVFLELNELERNQLVSRDWNRVVKNGLEYYTFSPRRRIHEVFITHQICKIPRRLFTFKTVSIFIYFTTNLITHIFYMMIYTDKDF